MDNFNSERRDKQMKFGLSDCEKYVKILTELLDDNWIKSELKKREKLDPSLTDDKQIHPLVLMLNLVKEHFEICKKDKSRNPTEEILRLASLGYYIGYLKNQNTIGLTDKIKELMSSSYPNFEKTTYEIRTAQVFSELGYETKFIESTSERKSHDILLCGNIEVECKKKSTLSDKNLINMSYWERIEAEIIKKMDEIGENYFVSIQTIVDLNDNAVNHIIEKTKQLLDEKKDGEYTDESEVYLIKKISHKNESVRTSLSPLDIQSYKHDNILAEQKKMINNIVNIDVQNLIYNANSRLVSYGSFEIQNNEVWIRDFRVIACNTKGDEDRFKSVINSISEGRKQLSGNRASIVCVELSGITKFWGKDDHEKMAKMIEDYLEKNNTISGVIITRESYNDEKGKLVFQEERYLFRNKKAIYSIPQDFKF